jgi:hypothetical protein
MVISSMGLSAVSRIVILRRSNPRRRNFHPESSERDVLDATAGGSVAEVCPEGIASTAGV